MVPMKPTPKVSKTPKDHRKQSPSRLPRLVFVGVLIAAAILGGVFFFPLGDRLEDSQRVDLATAALLEGRFDMAEELASEIAGTSPQFVQGRLIAGEAAMRDGRNRDAIAHFEMIADSRDDQALLASFSLGELYRTEGMLAESIAAFQKVLASKPDNGDAHARLAFLYGVTGQRWESMVHHLALIPARDWTIDSLALLGDIERPIERRIHKIISCNWGWLRKLFKMGTRRSR